MIRKGIFEDRRKNRSLPPLTPFEQKLRWLMPMLRLSIQIFLLAGICAWTLGLMRSGKIQEMLLNIP